MTASLRKQMRTLTLAALRSGIADSHEMRHFIARNLGADIDSRFVSTHAWALVDQQGSGDIVKRSTRRYALARANSDPELVVPAPSEREFPSWARAMVARANRRNGPSVPRFTENDLIALWHDCDAKCAVTGLAFSFARVGKGLVQRVYAPSLDRIEAGEPYTRENCRLVMAAVSSAMNTWGADVYLRLAEAAVTRRSS